MLSELILYFFHLPSLSVTVAFLPSLTHGSQTLPSGRLYVVLPQPKRFSPRLLLAHSLTSLIFLQFTPLDFSFKNANLDTLVNQTYWHLLNFITYINYHNILTKKHRINLSTSIYCISAMWSPSLPFFVGGGLTYENNNYPPLSYYYRRPKAL